MIIMNPAKYVQPTAQPLLFVSKDLPFLDVHRSDRSPIAVEPGDTRVAMRAQIGGLEGAPRSKRPR
jgi:hypothetical protein